VTGSPPDAPDESTPNPAATGAGDETSAPKADPDVHHDRSGLWLALYVYGTISTLVAIAGLTFETNPGALTAAGVVVVGAVAIWLAHTLSRLVVLRSWQQLELHWADVRRELRGSWSILTAAIPATLIFILAGLGLWKVKWTAFTLAEIVGVLALAVVGWGTAGGRGRPLGRRLLYVGGLVLVGVLIVLLELLVHLIKHGGHGGALAGVVGCCEG
jgi:hypothetical protein